MSTVLIILLSAKPAFSISQEAQVVSRVTELRKEGLWSSKRLPRVQEPPRQKAHWDYLLEEMTWLAADFVQERKWKKAAARKVWDRVVGTCLFVMKTWWLLGAKLQALIGWLILVHGRIVLFCFLSSRLF